MKLSYKAKFRVKGNGIKASGSGSGSGSDDGNTAMLNDYLVVEAPYGRKVKLDVATRKGNSADINVLVLSAIPVEITVTAYDEDVEVPDNVLHIDAPKDRKVTADYDYVAGDTDDIHVIVWSNQHMQVALVPSIQVFQTGD